MTELQISKLRCLRYDKSIRRFWRLKSSNVLLLSTLYRSPMDVSISMATMAILNFDTLSEIAIQTQWRYYRRYRHYC